MKEGWPPRHTFDSSMGPPYPKRWIVWVFWFPVFKVSHSQLSQKKGSTPHPSPTLSSEPSERKPRSHATCPAQASLWCFSSAFPSARATPQGASSPRKSEAEPVPLLSDLDASPEASVRLHKPGSTRVERKENGARGPAVQGTFFLGAPVTRFTPCHMLEWSRCEQQHYIPRVNLPGHVTWGHLLSNLGKAPRGLNIKELKVVPRPSASSCILLNQKKMVPCAT